MQQDDDFGGNLPSVAAVCTDERQRAKLVRLAEDAGCRLLAGRGLDALPVPPDILLVALSSKSDEDRDFWSQLALYCDAHRCNALVWIDMQRLEDAYAAVPHAHFIVDGADDEAAALLSRIVARESAAQVREGRKGSDFVALHRISDELAGVARRLADMADQARPPAPPLTLVPQAEPAVKAQPVTAADIRLLIRRRRLREHYFGGEMLADPAWDILLDLFAAGMEEKDVSVSSLCIAAAVPPTTALRWIGAMTEAGMLVRRFDPKDGRRIFISLSTDAETRMRQYFAALGDGPAAI